MSLPRKFVFDTNALISAALLKNSLTAKAYDHAVSVGRIAISDMVLDEFIEVLFRKKLDPISLPKKNGWSQFVFWKRRHCSLKSKEESPIAKPLTTT
jgi:predicted nucleic acid-binding protein